MAARLLFMAAHDPHTRLANHSRRCALVCCGYLRWPPQSRVDVAAPEKTTRNSIARCAATLIVGVRSSASSSARVPEAARTISKALAEARRRDRDRRCGSQHDCGRRFTPTTSRRLRRATRFCRCRSMRLSEPMPTEKSKSSGKQGTRRSQRAPVLLSGATDARQSERGELACNARTDR